VASDPANPAKKAAKAPREVPAWKPAPEAKAQSTRLRLIALVLWVVAIALEAVAIFWVLRPPFEQLAAAHGFPQWRWWLLLGFIVVIGVLSVVGSQLWKKANHLDPASSKEPIRFFVQNQLGAIIALIAFVPLIIMIFLNKDMNGQQKGIAGAVGIVVALVAVFAGIDFKPLSSEQSAVESQVVTHLVGQDLVWWSEGGNVVHLCQNASDLQNVKTPVQSGTIETALGQRKEGITLELRSELTQCGLPVPDDIDEVVAWVRQARGAA